LPSSESATLLARSSAAPAALDNFWGAKT
jgi:hypothetical protein